MRRSPITPFISRVRELYEKAGISSVIVAGSSGSYFHTADVVIQMKEYLPLDITEKAREEAAPLSGSSDRLLRLPHAFLPQNSQGGIRSPGTGADQAESAGP